MHRFLTGREAAIVQAAGIPVDSFNPARWWIVCLDRESEMPDDLELRQLRSIVEFATTSGFVGVKPERILAERPLPWDSGYNSLIFRKFDHSGIPGWRYRRASWRDGPMYVPDRQAIDYKPLDLVAAMDRQCNLRSEQWAAWKADHADLFSAQEVS